MQLFACSNCRSPVYFDNFQCVACGDRLAFLPDVMTMSALEALAETFADGVTRYRALGVEGKRYRMCKNADDHAACNWAIPDDDPDPLCRACRLNDVIPDLEKPGLRDAWLRLEAAKRRLLYSLFQLDLPVESRQQRPEDGLQFNFMAGKKKQPVFTGHNNGIITINVAEADDPFREKMREQMGETYRTVLGHFRHEIGHYYWDRLIKDSAPLEQFRTLFGDEQLDYQEALDRHYKNGPPANWNESYVSAYATMHPWEDWAETWAHYLHIFDTLETAKTYGLRVEFGKGTREEKLVDANYVSPDNFEQMTQDWVPLTLALNSINRSMGMRDLYPFVLSETALKKLRFVHDVIRTACERASRIAAANEPVAPVAQATPPDANAPQAQTPPLMDSAPVPQTETQQVPAPL